MPRFSATSMAVFALLATTTSGKGICPSSKAWPHASCEVNVETTASCTAAITEVVARVNGQYDAWHDPHNNGTYTILADDTASGGLLQMQRLTGNEKYTDKINFSFEADSTTGGCLIDACSESQVTSIGDASTNYCNSRMLYCGSADGCKGVTSEDLGATELKVSPSAGASTDKSACLQV